MAKDGTSITSYNQASQLCVAFVGKTNGEEYTCW